MRIKMAIAFAKDGKKRQRRRKKVREKEKKERTKQILKIVMFVLK